MEHLFQLFESGKNELVQYFINGGPMMYPILFCSIVSWAIIFERIVRLRRRRLFNDDLVHDVKSSLSTGDFNTAQEQWNGSGVLAAKVISSGIDEFRHTQADVETAMQGAAERKLRVLWSNMIALNTIARVATMLGLLGTVVGMVKGFKVLGENVNKEELAKAIGIALTTTVGGLCVAIPAIVGESALRSKINRIIAEFEEIVLEVIKAVRIGKIPKAIDISDRISEQASKSTEPAESASEEVKSDSAESAEAASEEVESDRTESAEAASDDAKDADDESESEEPEDAPKDSPVAVSEEESGA